MGFLIDTYIWVDVERGVLSPSDIAAATGEEPVFLSPVTSAEMKFGAESAGTADIRQKRNAALARLKRKPTLAIDEIAGEIFGDLDAQLRKSDKGNLYRVQDLWLASQAVQHGLQFLTHKREDFADIPSLSMIVWADVAPEK